MRLGIKILNVGASINSYKQVSQIKIAQGETVDLVFQLVDLDQNGLRYIPADGATVRVQIPRSPDIYRVDQSSRRTEDDSIDREADVAFTGDRSIWKLPLIEADTQNMVSTSIRIVLDEGGKKKISTCPQAIKIIKDQQD